MVSLFALGMMTIDEVSTKEYLVTYWDVHTHRHIYELYIEMFSSLAL